jgi:hypothetical protein
VIPQLLVLDCVRDNESPIIDNAPEVANRKLPQFTGISGVPASGWSDQGEQFFPRAAFYGLCRIVVEFAAASNIRPIHTQCAQDKADKVRKRTT